MKTPKYERVRQSLLARIHAGEFPVGSRFPSIESTSREMQASYVTTQRAYRLLAEEGVLSSGPGLQGTRVIATAIRPEPPRQVVLGGIFRPLRQRNEVENFALDMFEGVCRTLTLRRMGMIHHRIGHSLEQVLESADRAVADFQSGAVQGIILDQVVPDEAVRRVAEAGCAAVQFGRHPEGISIDSVAPDMEWCGREVGRLAVEAGYRRMVLCHVLDPRLHDTPRGRAVRPFYDAYMTRASESAFPSSGVVPRYEPPIEEQERFHAEDELFCRYMGVPPAPDGVRTLFVMHTDRLALRLVRILGARGFRVPEDAGVIGLVDAECNRAAARPVTTWRIDPFAIGRTAVETLLDRLEFPERPRVRQYLKPVYVDHGTL